MKTRDSFGYAVIVGGLVKSCCQIEVKDSLSKEFHCIKQRTGVVAREGCEFKDLF